MNIEKKIHDFEVNLKKEENLHHFVLFMFIIWVLLFLSTFKFFFKDFNIDFYNYPALGSIYSYINTNLTIYDLLISGIVSSTLSYITYITLYNYLSNKFLIIIIPIISLIGMYYTNTFNSGAFIYSCLAIEYIPIYKYGYLYSYFLCCIVIIISYYIFVNLYNLIPNHYHFVKNVKFQKKKWY
jgi:hypothetical protein